MRTALALADWCVREWNACIYVRIRARAHFLLSQFGVPVWFVIFGLHVFVTLSVVSHSCKYSGREQKKIDKISLHIFTSSGLMKTLCVWLCESILYIIPRYSGFAYLYKTHQPLLNSFGECQAKTQIKCWSVCACIIHFTSSTDVMRQPKVNGMVFVLKMWKMRNEMKAQIKRHTKPSKDR